jgi:hypothetical protein
MCVRSRQCVLADGSDFKPTVQGYESSGSEMDDGGGGGGRTSFVPQSPSHSGASAFGQAIGGFGGGGAFGSGFGDDGGKIERALRHGSLNGKGQVIVFVADIAPEQVTDFGVRRQLRLTSGPGILSNEASSAPAGDGPVAVSASSWPVCTVMKPSALRWLCNGAGARGVRRLSLVAAAGFSRYDRRVNRAAPALCRPELFCR